MARGRTTPPSSVATALDGLLFFMAAWCVLPALLGHPKIDLPIPFASYSSELSRKHLLEFWVLLFIRQLVPVVVGGGSALARRWTESSAAFRGVIVLASSMIVFLAAHPHHFVSGDTVGAKLLPVTILDQGNLDLDEFMTGIEHGHRYSTVLVAGHRYPTFPLLPGLLALPVYAIVRTALPAEYHDWPLAYSYADGDDQPNVVNAMESVTAALLSALSVLLVWQFSRIVSDGREEFSLWVAAAYGLATPIMSTASEGLWMHGPSCLFLSGTCLLLARRRGGSTSLWLAGALAGLAIAARPSSALPVGVIALAIVFTERAGSWRFVGGALAAFAPIAALNESVYGSAIGEYGRFGGAVGSANPLIVATLLFSPSRGLFVWSSYLLVPAAFAVVTIARRPGPPAVLLAAATSLVLLVSAYDAWSGGYSLGPRLLCEAALLLTLILPFAATAIEARPFLRLTLILAILVSAHIHTVAALRNDHGWSTEIFQGVQEPARFWSIRDSQLAWVFR